MTACLTAENLVIHREKNGARFSLTVPRLSVFRGRTLAVVGSSGCGKSTLLDMLALILRPMQADHFTLHIEGRDENLLQASQRRLADIRGTSIGYVLQSGGLLSFLTVEENILLPGRLLGHPGDLLRDRARMLAERLGITGQLPKKPQHLSGGQRQRVAIARALVHSPCLVLADEPTAAVDQNSARDICSLFTATAREMEAALVIVSHDRPLMERTADEMVTFRVERRGVDDVCSTLTPRGAL